MSTIAGIAYRAMEIGGVPVPGSYFACPEFGATLSSDACGRRWETAHWSSPCASCETGRLHRCGPSEPGQEASELPVPIQSRRSGTCLRCGGTERPMLFKQLCAHCYKAGRRASSRHPNLQDHVVALRVDGLTVYRELRTIDAAEAIAAVARRHLVGGSTFTDEQPGLPVWDAAAGRFHYVDRATGRPIMVLRLAELSAAGRPIRGSALLRYMPLPDDGELPGGWALAVPRQQVTLLEAEAAALVLDAEEVPADWTLTAYVCGSCRRGVLEARRTDGLAQLDVRCPACGQRADGGAS